MYGQGKYASGPPFQQRPPSQQGPPSLRPPLYQHGPPPPPPPPPPVQASGIRSGQQYLNTCPPPPPPPSMQVHGSSQVPQYYSTGQHHSQWAQIMFQVQPEIPTSGTGNAVQPSLLGQGPPRGPVFPVGGQVQPEIPTSRTGNAVQPSLLGQGPPRAPVFPVGGQVQHDPSLTPLQKPSKSLPPPPYNSYMYPMSECPQFRPMVPPPPLPASLPQSPPHPLPLPPGASASPAHEVQLSADDLGQSCSNDSRRHDKVSDPVNRVMTPNQSIGNLPAHDDSLENGGATSSSLQHHSLTYADTSHSPSNSDMDMEDDITHPAEDESICLSNFNHGLPSGPVTDSQTAVEHECASVGPEISRDYESSSRNSFQISDSSIVSKNSELQVNSMTHQSSCPDYVFDQCSVSVDLAEKGFENPANNTTKKYSPLNLLGDYSSDDSAENSEAHVRVAKQEAVPSVPSDRTAGSGPHLENNLINDHEPKNLLNSEKGFDPLVESSGVSSDLSKSNVKSQSDIPISLVGSSAARDIEDSTDHKNGSQKASKIGSSLEVLRDDTKAGIAQKEVLKSTTDMSKVDEFGRLVREDHSDNDSGDSPSFTQRRSKRGRSRSWSRSPKRGRSRSRSRSPRSRRRTSPWRRRGRHGRSRSTSPKRRRSRSRSRSRSLSPSYRHAGEIGNEKTRRYKSQLPECLDYNRGKCYRGSSCRYFHRQSNKTTDRLPYSHTKQQSHDVAPVSKTSNVHGDTDPISPNRSVHEHKEHDESKNFKQEVPSTGESRGLTEELCDARRDVPYTETLIGVTPDVSNCQTQLIEGQAAAENSLQTSTSVQRPYLNKDSVSTSYGHLMSTEQPFASESTMPRSYLQELSSSVGTHSSNSLVCNSSPSTTQIPRDYNLILQHSQFPPPSTASWKSLPPPPPLPFPFPNNAIANTSSGLPSAQFQQNLMPPCGDLRYEASTGIGLPGIYSQMPEPHKSLYDSNRFGPRIMPVMNKPMDQIHGPPSHMQPYMHHSPYGLLPTPAGVPAHYGEPGNAINHFPPLAPTLNELLTSKFSSNIVTQRKDVPYCDIYGTPYSSNHASADGLPAPASDQYDPLSDSIEPSSSSVKKLDYKLPTSDSDVLRTSGSNQFIDMDGNNRHKGNGGGEGFLSAEKDDYGETADAEVGDVEDGSTSNPQSADISAEEDEINHVKASGKTKKGKDSKSMKTFKIAIADFVKEVLKPSWRQGNMSKEAFKTIVKKTVDKVSVATGKHHIPKSREKIDHYIDSQQRKLTKLVMGYVDKYVKA